MQIMKRFLHHMNIVMKYLSFGTWKMICKQTYWFPHKNGANWNTLITVFMITNAINKKKNLKKLTKILFSVSKHAISLLVSALTLRNEQGVAPLWEMISEWSI